MRDCRDYSSKTPFSPRALTTNSCKSTLHKITHPKRTIHIEESAGNALCQIPTPCSRITHAQKHHRQRRAIRLPPGPRVGCPARHLRLRRRAIPSRAPARPSRRTHLPRPQPQNPVRALGLAQTGTQPAARIATRRTGTQPTRTPCIGSPGIGKWRTASPPHSRRDRRLPGFSMTTRTAAFRASDSKTRSPSPQCQTCVRPSLSGMFAARPSFNVSDMRPV